MDKRRTALWITVPGVAAVAWQRYRRVVRRLDMAPAASPPLPGVVRSLATSWGRLSYRISEGDSSLRPLVLVHGWGRTGDSAWWPLIARTTRTVLALDLPGHGRSLLDRRFTLRLAGDAVLACVEDAGLERPLLVGHSMGGAVALTALRKSGSEVFSTFVALASSAYWVEPRQRVKLIAGPYVLGPQSPFLIRAQRRELSRLPDEADRIAWEYAVRAPRQVLFEATAELRRFDARRWGLIDMPSMTWVVTTEDGLIDPRDQRASAHIFDARIIEVPTDHSVVVEAPDLVHRLIEAVDARPAGPLLVAV